MSGSAPEPVQIMIRQEGDRWVVEPNGSTVNPGQEVKWISEGSDLLFWFPQEDVFGQAMEARSEGEELILSPSPSSAGRRVAYAVYVVAKEGFALGLEGNEPHILIGDGP